MKTLATALAHTAMLVAALMLATLGGFAPARASQDLAPLVQPIAMLDDEDVAGSTWKPGGEEVEAVEEAAVPDQEAVVLDRPVLSEDELPEDIDADGGATGGIRTSAGSCRWPSPSSPPPC